MTTPNPSLKQNGMPGNAPPVTRITIARAHKGEHSFVERERETETETERERQTDRQTEVKLFFSTVEILAHTHW